MLAKHRQNIFIGIVAGALFVALYAFYLHQYKAPWCNNKDKALCTMLTHIQKQLISRSSGTYINDNAIEVVWSMHKGAYEYTYLVDQKNIMSVVGTQDTMYILDPKDNKWWKQPTKLVEEYDVQLPFEPQRYLPHMIAILLHEETVFTPISSPSCSLAHCGQYKARNTSQGAEYILTLNTEDNSLRVIDSNNGNIAEKITLVYNQVDSITLPETDIKIPPSNKNVLLDVIYQLQPSAPVIPEYVEVFEQQLQQAQQRGELQGGPQYITPTAQPLFE